ncbi:DUF2750 domain-containing protein [Burkholderia glumae]|nr:DUF2750 domain-containing protein [Burkholderia glumae]
MKAHPRKIENVLGLGKQERCDYFVRKVADFEVVWGLRDSGWASGEVGGRIAVPFWPEADFASRCTVGEWSGFHAVSEATSFLGTHEGPLDAVW